MESQPQPSKEDEPEMSATNPVADIMGRFMGIPVSVVEIPAENEASDS